MTDAEAARIFDELSRFTAVHGQRIAETCMDGGGLAVIVINPGKVTGPFLRHFGWRGEPVLAMPHEMWEALAGSDHVTRQWVMRRWEAEDDGPLRVLMVIDEGTMLLDFDGAWSVEPGSLDADVSQ
jgi:hypothetical protein